MINNTEWFGFGEFQRRNKDINEQDFMDLVDRNSKMLMEQEKLLPRNENERLVDYFHRFQKFITKNESVTKS